MIQFFRRIRQKLLEENRFVKYLMYALGEIVLVVIGILIALQINNWNEAKKEREIEIEVLLQFKEDLEGDRENIENVEFWMQKVIYSSTVVVDQLKNKRAWHDSLAIHFDLWNDFEQLGLNTVAISNLRSRGAELISNKELRNSIVKLYDKTYFYISKSNEFFREDHIHMSYPKFVEHIEPIKWREGAIPSDYEALLQDQEFINTVQWIRNAAEFDSEYHLKTIKEINLVLDEINQELKNYAQ